MAVMSVKALEALKPTGAWYRVAVDRGLSLRVAPDGLKVWVVRYVVGGTRRQARLPRPFGKDVDGFMSLVDARAENARIQALARTGIDFEEQAAEQQRARAEEVARAAREAQQIEAANKPFQAMFTAWLDSGVQRKDGNAELRRMFNKDVLPAIGTVPVKNLTDHHLRAVLRAMVARGVYRMASRAHADLVQLCNWADEQPEWRRLMRDGNPAGRVDLAKILPYGTNADAPRERTLSPAEIRELRDTFAAMENAHTSAPDRRAASRPVQRETQIALWLCLSTACRIGELLMSEWQHIDADAAIWFIPAANTKKTRAGQRDQTVFLSNFAHRQFAALREITGSSPWCFPARQHDDGHIDVKTVSKQVGDRQVRFKDRKALKNRRSDDSLVLAGGANREWTPHDLRRTAATMLQALGVDLNVVDRCQNHVMVGSKVRRSYLHHDYADETRAAWQALGERLEAILA